MGGWVYLLVGIMWLVELVGWFGLVGWVGLIGLVGLGWCHGWVDRWLRWVGLVSRLVS